MMVSVISILVSFALSLSMVAFILRLAHKRSWYDQVNERKIHSGDIPRLGGIGFASAYIIISLFTIFFDHDFSPGLRFLGPIAGLVIVLILGVIDDFSPLSSMAKLPIQGISALLVILPGYTFARPFFIESGWLRSLEWTRYPLTFIWIMGMINAMNFIDGIDGLSAGISTIIALSYAALFVFLLDTGPGAIFCLYLAAVLLGFLVFNAPFPQAKIFMGDGGSQFLGFILALLPLITQNPSQTPSLPMFYAGALVLIPVYDTVAAIWRRIRDHKPIDKPDKAHIHHKLMNLGLSAWGINGVLYGLQALLCGLVLAAVKIKGPLSLVLLLSAYLSCLIFFAIIHFLNRRVNKLSRESQKNAAGSP